MGVQEEESLRVCEALAKHRRRVVDAWHAALDSHRLVDQRKVRLPPTQQQQRQAEHHGRRM